MLTISPARTPLVNRYRDFENGPEGGREAGAGIGKGSVGDSVGSSVTCFFFYVVASEFVMRLSGDRIVALVLRGRERFDVGSLRERLFEWFLVFGVVFGWQLFRESAIGVAHAQLRAMCQRRDANPFAVDISPVRAGQVVQHEKATFEDNLRVMPRHLRIAQNNVVSGVAADGERAVRLKAIALLCPVQTDEEQFGHFERL